MNKENKFKIMTWNVQGEASLGWNNQYKIKSNLVDKIIEQQADIVVLTAFVVAKGIDYLFEHLQNEGYIWFQGSCSGKNGILIAIKENLINSKKQLVDSIYENNIIHSNVSGCNILSVKIPLKNERSLSIIGCRMETGKNIKSENNNNKDYRELLRIQYDLERKNFDNILIPLIKEHTKNNCLAIVCGDFNNAKCYGDLTKSFNEQDYIDNKGKKSHFNYNINIIKDELQNHDLIMADIQESGESITTHIKEDRYGKTYDFPLDHIFLKGFTSQKCYTIPESELSDHFILISEAILNQ